MPVRIYAQVVGTVLLLLGVLGLLLGERALLGKKRRARQS